ncbi:putative bifunctional diguanylate cyclase/phosphodiesterase [Thiomonas intermedia]|uniref:putative bifunctional diguanylate cyclase/phosphodiesterase n=1 Tax=Thiomonas intermedia TaxID=926 RepID=UPI001473E9C2|nr:EAL domain-containing protein [Thiomonas intermedia]
METLPPLLAQALETDNSQSERTHLQRLQRLFSISYAVVILVTLALFGLYALQHWRNERQKLNHRLAFNAQLLAGATDGRLQQYAVLSDSLAMSIRRNPRLLNDASALQLRLRQAQAALEGITVIRVVDADGQILGSTAPLGPSFELRNNPLIWTQLLNAQQSGHMVVGPLVRLPTMNRRVLPQLQFYPASGETPAFWIGIGIERMAFNRLWVSLARQNQRDDALREAEGFLLVRQDGYVLARWPDVPRDRIDAFYGHPQTGALVRSLQDHPDKAEMSFAGVVHSVNQRRVGYWIRIQPNAPDLAVAVSLPYATLVAAYWTSLIPTLVAALALLTILALTYLFLLGRMRAESLAIDERHETLLSYNEHLRQLAERDYLTKLPNRRYLMAQLGRLSDAAQRERGQRFAVGILDLDDFKRVNDTYGHHEGDQFLKILASKLQNVLRDDDTLVRLGGDEFAVILHHIAQERDALNACQRLLDSARTLIELSNQNAIQVTASLGLAIWPDDGMAPDALLRHADQAMYAAKQAGKNVLQRYQPDMEAQAQARQNAYDLLEQALSQQWLSLHYQPILCISGAEAGRITGVEALLRIRHPEQGVLAAQTFISALDAPHLARPVGRWVLQQAMGQAQYWNAQGLNLGMMVNISAVHFLSPDWLSDLSEALTAHPGLQPAQVKIEITESGALRDLDVAARVMMNSTHAGVRIALDDFGQGETTLRYLQRLPAHTIKIDQSFVRDMIDDPHDYAIVVGLLDMASLMGLITVAEGVEGDGAMQLLASLGCTHAQGYGIARPMPAEALPGWIAQWQPPTFPKPIMRVMPNLPEIQRQRFLRLRAAAQGDGEFPQNVMMRDAERYCHLGQWLNGSGQFFYGADPRYADFHRRHALIHELARRARAAADAGDHKLALQLVLNAQAINDALLQDLQTLATTTPPSGA